MSATAGQREDDGRAGTGPSGAPVVRKPPRRALVGLAVLALLAALLIVAPRPANFYARAIVDVPQGIQLDFLFDGKKDKAGCEALLAALVKSVAITCPQCQTHARGCDKTLSGAQSRRLQEAPLDQPSARMSTGTIVYSAKQDGVALAVCRESERQSAGNGPTGQIVCFPSGAVRSRSTAERSQHEAGRTTYTLMLAVAGGIIASLVLAIAFAYARDRKTLATRAKGPAGIVLAPSHPWLQKLVLAGVDAVLLLIPFLALSWPASDYIERWNAADRAAALNYALDALLTIGWFWVLLEHYARRRPFWDELREIFRVLIVMFVVSAAVAFIAGIDAGRKFQFLVWSLNFLLIPLGRIGAKRMLADFGLWQQPAVIVGTGENARSAYMAIQGESGMGYRVIAFVNENPDEHAQAACVTIGGTSIPVISAYVEIKALLDALNSPQVIVALESLASDGTQVLVQKVLSASTSVHVIPPIRGLPLFGTQLSHFFSHQVLFLTVRNNLSRRGYQWAKRGFDLVASSILLVVLSPLLFVLAVLVRRTKGPALYGHRRIGRNGRPFRCLKFRSMRMDAEKVLAEMLEHDPVARAQWERDYKLKDDPRVTTAGRFLRRTSLDELPQLINVFRGEMSLVGPRPIVAEELVRYGTHAGLYLEVRPGMTGLWQVSGRNDTGYAERVNLDSWYVQNWSMWYDIVILFRTVGVVRNRRGAY